MNPRDRAFVRHLETRRLVPPTELRNSIVVRDEMARAGLDLPLSEVLLRRGLIDPATAACGTAAPVRTDVEQVDDATTRQAVLSRGLLSGPDLDAVVAFQTWAEAQGLRLGLAEILVRRGLVPADALRPPAGSGRSTTRRQAATRSRPRTSRQDLSPARPRRRDLAFIAGIATGAIVPLVAAIVIVAAASSDDPPAPGPAADPPAANASGPVAPQTPSRPAIGLDREFAELDERVVDHMRNGRFDRARREIDSFEEAMPAENRTASAKRLAAARRFVDDQEEVARSGEGTPRSGAAVAKSTEIEDLLRRIDLAERQGRAGEALEHHGRLLEIDPGNFSFLFGRARLLVDAGRLEEARRDLDGAVAGVDGRFPGHRLLPRILILRSQVAEILFDHDAARADLARSIEIEPFRGFPVYVLGRLARKAGDPERAIEVLEGIGDRPLDREQALMANLEYALALLDSGDRAACLAHLDGMRPYHSETFEAESIAACAAWAWLHPAFPDADRARAERLLPAEMQIRPVNSPYWLIVWALLLAERDPVTACRIFEIRPNGWTSLVESGFHYARALLATGKRDEARRVYEAASKLRPALAPRFALDSGR